MDFSKAYTELQGILAETREELALSSLDRARLLKQVEHRIGLWQSAEARATAAEAKVERLGEEAP